MFATLKMSERICWRKFNNFWIYTHVFWKSDVWNIMESQPPDSIRSSGTCSSQMPGSCRHASPCPLLSLADMAVIQNSPCSTAVYTPEIQRGTACYSWGLLIWTYGTVSSGFCSPGNQSFEDHHGSAFLPFLQVLSPSAGDALRLWLLLLKPWSSDWIGMGSLGYFDSVAMAPVYLIVSLWSTDFHCVCCFINASSVTRIDQMWPASQCCPWYNPPWCKPKVPRWCQSGSRDFWPSTPSLRALQWPTCCGCYIASKGKEQRWLSGITCGSCATIFTHRLSFIFVQCITQVTKLHTAGHSLS